MKAGEESEGDGEEWGGMRRTCGGVVRWAGGGGVLIYGSDFSFVIP